MVGTRRFTRSKQRQYKAGGRDVGREIVHMAGGALGSGPGNQESCLRLLTRWFPVRLGQWRKWWDRLEEERRKKATGCVSFVVPLLLVPPPAPPPAICKSSSHAQALGF